MCKHARFIHVSCTLVHCSMLSHTLVIVYAYTYRCIYYIIIINILVHTEPEQCERSSNELNGSFSMRRLRETFYDILSLPPCTHTHTRAHTFKLSYVFLTHMRVMRCTPDLSLIINIRKVYIYFSPRYVRHNKGILWGAPPHCTLVLHLHGDIRHYIRG